MAQKPFRRNELLRWILEIGYVPTYKEIARHFGTTSPTHVSRMLSGLVKDGYLERQAPYKIKRDLNKSGPV